MDGESFALKANTKDIIKDLQNPEELFDFSNLTENLELFSDKNKKVMSISKKKHLKLFA